MDRIILISMATGMLSFHQRYSPIDPENTEKDEMQLASYFSALQHVRDTFSRIESTDEIQYSIHEQGCSSWTTGLVKHNTGLYILAFYSKYIRFSTHFWKVVFPTMQKELIEAPLNSLDQLKSKRALQNILQIAWAKSIEILAQKLPFAKFPSVACELCGCISEKNSNSLLNIPSLQLSLKSASLSPVPLNSRKSSSTILDNISPRPKSVELRSIVEEVNEHSRGNHYIPIKSNNVWCCFGPASSVSAVSHNSVHLEPVTKNATNVSQSVPTESSPPLSTTSSPSPIKCIDSMQFSRISFSPNQNDEINYMRLCQQYITQPSEGKDSIKLLELDKDWNIVFHVHSFEDKNDGKKLNPPSPLTAMVDENGSQNNDLQLLCLEDDNPPSPPRKHHNSQTENDDLHPIEKFVIAMGPSMCTVFRLSFKSNAELNECAFTPTQCFNTFAVEEFHHCYHFCNERGWLTEKQQTLRV